MTFPSLEKEKFPNTGYFNVMCVNYYMPSPSHLLSDLDTQSHLLFSKCNCLHFIDEDTKPSLIVGPSAPILCSYPSVMDIVIFSQICTMLEAHWYLELLVSFQLWIYVLTSCFPLSKILEPLFQIPSKFLFLFAFFLPSLHTFHQILHRSITIKGFKYIKKTTTKG